MSSEFRRAAPEDAESLLRFRRQLYTETDFMLYQAVELKDYPEESLRYINDLIGRANSELIVAVDAGQIVGFVAAAGNDLVRLRHGARLALGVLKSHWSKGVGSGLLENIREWAHDAAVVRLELTVRVDNARAIELYLRHGFAIEGRRRSSININGNYFDDYLMSLINQFSEPTSA